MDKEGPRDITPLWKAGIMMGNDGKLDTVVHRLAVNSLLICRVALV